MNSQDAMIRRYLAKHMKEMVGAILKAREYTKRGKIPVYRIMNAFNEDKSIYDQQTPVSMGMTLRTLGFKRAWIDHKRGIIWDQELIDGLSKI